MPQTPSFIPDSQVPDTLSTVDQIAAAIAKRESGGNYAAKSPVNANGSVALGKYQILDTNIPSWSKEAMGKSITPDEFLKNPAAQEAIAKYHMSKMYDQYGNPQDVAATWFSGKPAAGNNAKDVLGTSTSTYVGDVMHNIGGIQTAHAATTAPPDFIPDSATPSATGSPDFIPDSEMGKYGGGQFVTPPEITTQTFTPQNSTQGMTAAQIADQESAKKYGALVGANTDQGTTPGAYVSEPLKAVANMPTSIYGFGKGVVNSVLHPIDTLKAIASDPYHALVPEAVQGALHAAKGGIQYATAGGDLTKEAAGLQAAGEGLQTVQRAVTNDPFGQISPIIAAAEGGVKAIDRFSTKAAMADYVKNIAENTDKGVPIPTASTAASDMFNKAISTVASPVTEGIPKIMGKVTDLGGKMAESAYGHATGLEPETIRTTMQTPDLVKQAREGNITRESVGQEVQSALDEYGKQFDEAGTAYQGVRDSKVRVKVDPNYVDNSIKDATGVDIKNGQVQTSGGASVRAASDLRALQNLYDTWKPEFKKGYLTTEEYLNFRQDLSNMAKFEREITSSQPLLKAGRQMRKGLNDTYRSKVPGLEKTDANFEFQKGNLDRLSQGLLDKDGNLKPNAYDTIANSVGKTFKKGELLSRLEEINPGITAKLKAMKAADDFTRATGNKVGTYSRSLLGHGGLIAGLATMNVPVIIASLVEMGLTNPEIAFRILSKMGAPPKVVIQVMEGLKKGAKKVNNLPNSPAALKAGVVANEASTAQRSLTSVK